MKSRTTCVTYDTSSLYHRFEKLNLLRRAGKKFSSCSFLKNEREILFVCLFVCSAHAKISVMYAHERMSDMMAEQCLNEMFPKGRRFDLQESDESCIIYCVLKKFGIMNENGQINLDIYRKRVRQAHQLDNRHIMDDRGGACVESAEATQYKQDVCKKAKVFNDCTHLYRLVF